jgi:branched-chain amino acid aminotransferase
MSIATQKVADSRVNQLDPKDIKFGKIYSDHMLVAKYSDGQWHKAEIVPYGDISMSPSTTVLHYGQAIFEGIKAYKNVQGEISIFRPEENHKRFHRIAERMGMPDVPEEIFMDGMRELISLDRNWVPDSEGCSLYIRPFMIGTDAFIGVKPAEEFAFYIITSPAGAYYADPIRIYVHHEYTRAFPGGIGFTKAAGNYGACMYPTMQVRKLGYDQILWTDAVEHKYVQEIGTMNVFFVLNGVVVTPDLTEGTILQGVTRDSIITLLQTEGYTVEERPLSINEIVEAHANGQLQEIFGAGTAAVVAPIKEIHYNGVDMQANHAGDGPITKLISTTLADIRYGRKEDLRGWMYKVC